MNERLAPDDRGTKPVCRFGYPESQLKEILGDRKEAFDRWFVGQTGAICDGREYNHETGEYEPTGCGPHGPVVYLWDVEQFLKGLPDLEFC